MPLGSIRRRITKHRRSVSGASTGSDGSSMSEKALRTAASISTPMPVPSLSPPSSRSGSPPMMPSRPVSLMVGRSDPPVRPPRFTRPRTAPRPPTESASASIIEHAPPARASVTPPPAIPRRAMPPWRVNLISLAQAYAPIDTPPTAGPSGHIDLVSRLHDPSLSERQALAVLRNYVDGIHASHRHGYSDMSDGDSDCAD